MKRVMFYLLASCMLLAVSSCELVSEPDSLNEQKLSSGTGGANDGGSVDPGPD